MVEVFMYVFFFKQKTAYEMRISDWSSDVCSSDLLRAAGHPADAYRLDRSMSAAPCSRPMRSARYARISSSCSSPGSGRSSPQSCATMPIASSPVGSTRRDRTFWKGGDTDNAEQNRSEEHTSEFQSLMRISYAVFCLKKKKTQQKVQQ